MHEGSAEVETVGVNKLLSLVEEVVDPSEQLPKYKESLGVTTSVTKSPGQLVVDY